MKVGQKEKMSIAKCSFVRHALFGSALLVSAASGCESRKSEEPENMTQMTFLNGAKISGCMFKADKKNPLEKDELAIHIVLSDEVPAGDTLAVRNISSQLGVVQINGFGANRKLKFPKCNRE